MRETARALRMARALQRNTIEWSVYQGMRIADPHAEHVPKASGVHVWSALATRATVVWVLARPGAWCSHLAKCVSVVSQLKQATTLLVSPCHEGTSPGVHEFMALMVAQVHRLRPWERVVCGGNDGAEQGALVGADRSTVLTAGYVAKGWQPPQGYRDGVRHGLRRVQEDGLRFADYCNYRLAVHRHVHIDSKSL